MRWRHVNTCCRLMCANHAYITIRCTLGVTCFGSRHFVNKVSGQYFSAENKQEVAEFYSQHLPMHFRGLIWNMKSKSIFPVSFNLISAEMNLVGNYRTLRGLRTINPEGLPSTGGYSVNTQGTKQTNTFIFHILKAIIQHNNYHGNAETMNFKLTWNKKREFEYTRLA